MSNINNFKNIDLNNNPIHNHPLWLPTFRPLSQKEQLINIRYKCTKCGRFRKESEIRNFYCSKCGNGKSMPLFYRNK